MDFSVIVPVYNNQATLKRVYKNITACFSSFQYTYEIVFIDDGSTDLSFEELLALKEEDNRVAIVRLQQNYNQSIAVLTGFEHASGKYIVTISADLQEEENLIHKLILFTQQYPNADLIIGYRSTNSDFFIYKMLSRLFYKIIQLKIPQMPLRGFDTGIISNDLKQKFILNYYEGIFIQAAFLQLAHQVQYVEYHRKKSAATTFRLKSIYFKLNYFVTCIRSVYFPHKASPASNKKKLYTVEKYLP